MGIRSNDHQYVGGKQYFEHEVQNAGNTGSTLGSGFTAANYESSLEINGTLVTEAFDTSTIVELLVTEQNEENIILEEQDLLNVPQSIKVETGGEFDRIVLDGSDATQGDAGDKILLETTAENISKIQLESTNRIVSEGQIPIESWTLNSSTNAIGGQRIVRSTEISTRTTGDIALEDFTGIPSGATELYSGPSFKLVLNGTDSSSTNAGDNFDLEGATGITI